MSFKIQYKEFGANALLIEWPDIIEEAVLSDIQNFGNRIGSEISEIEIIPSYNSLTIVDYHPKRTLKDLRKRAEEIYTAFKDQKKQPYTLWRIPVCYDPKFGIDLQRLAETKGLSTEEVIKLHTEAVYSIYCIGFLPGFMYLGGLAEILHTPRLNAPRLNIPRGAVGIGGNQTGVYPQDSPGGWNIIGNSPVRLFDTNRESPCSIRTGDKVQFYSVSLPEYRVLEIEVNASVFEMEKTEMND
ncbi:5-oxoprolinase subunit PxpB [Leptobacterium flavescens]|uniref:5-oxoprolinase subunit PxpB n=1 Tax=Leptobacterium flavescens TaxID=472055 RepID=A0A6P0UL25_9FLAO|nr:5-oxoprolinase subunit PxpB [Leptobacterium flavescens]NER13924.1 5-oxoprolinase subunit PxpB [Leptobacterium flavescens]